MKDVDEKKWRICSHRAAINAGRRSRVIACVECVNANQTTVNALAAKVERLGAVNVGLRESAAKIAPAIRAEEREAIRKALCFCAENEYNAEDGDTPCDVCRFIRARSGEGEG